MEPLDPNCTRLRPLATYADRLPSGRRGKRLNRATLWRWALRGLRGRPRLRTAPLGGTRVTCDAWVWEFLGSGHGERPRSAVGGLDHSTRARIAARLRVAASESTKTRAG